MIIHTPECRCPHCKHRLDAVGSDDESTPSKDDISICMHCQAILLFNEDLTLRIMEEEEFNALPTVVQHQITIERVRCKLMTGKINPHWN